MSGRLVLDAGNIWMDIAAGLNEEKAVSPVIGQNETERVRRSSKGCEVA